MTLLHNEVVVWAPGRSDVTFGVEEMLDPSMAGSLTDAADNACLVLFGGRGAVHGSIVDIDYFNHVYLDPLGKGVRYYSSTSPSPDVRVEYEDMRSLLREERPELLPAYERGASGYCQTLESAADGLSVVRQFDDALVRTTYAGSRIARSVQYLFDANVVRTWDEGMLSALTEMIGDSDFAEKARVARKVPLSLGGR